METVKTSLMRKNYSILHYLYYYATFLSVIKKKTKNKKVTIIFLQRDRKKILRSNFQWDLEQLQDMQNKYLVSHI